VDGGVQEHIGKVCLRTAFASPFLDTKQSNAQEINDESDRKPPQDQLR
jgi:hypothetical protein